MNAYIYKHKFLNNLNETNRCDICLVRTIDEIGITISQLIKGDLIFDQEGSCGIVKTILDDSFIILIVSKGNNYHKSNINATINRI